MKPAPKDVAQALGGGARLPAGRVGLRADVRADRESAPATEQPRRRAAIQIPKPPPPVLLSGTNAAKVCQKTRESDAFLPTANPLASKKVMENKDTNRLTPATSPRNSPNR